MDDPTVGEPTVPNPGISARDLIAVGLTLLVVIESQREGVDLNAALDALNTAISVLSV